MREHGRGCFEGLEEQHLFRRVRKVTDTPNHVCDLHVDVVRHHAEVVGNPPVSAPKHEVVDIIGRKRDRPKYLIYELDLIDVVGNREANHVLRARRHPGSAFFGRKTPTSASVAPGDPVPTRLVVALFLCAKAWIRMPGGDQLLDRSIVQVAPTALTVRPVRPINVQPLVPIEAQPAHVVQNALLAALDVARGVRVLDPENEDAVVVAREQPIERRGSDISEVQAAGWARGEARAYGHGPVIVPNK